MGDRNPFEYFDEEDFIKRYRFSKDRVHFIIDVLEDDHLKHVTNRNHAIPVHLQVTAALQYYATGTFQQTVGDTICLSQPTISRIVKDVSTALARRGRDFIKFPDEVIPMVQEFKDIRGFPQVTGLIDCTHIRISSPGGDQAERYRNRKGFISLNVQVICDARMRIMDIVARWHGSAHDSRIFHESSIKQRYLKL